MGAPERVSRCDGVTAYDVVVIGGGWGGYTAAARAAGHGLRTALVERDKIGGVCLHRGCIPTKVLLETAGLLALTRDSDRFGVTLPPPQLDYPRVRERMGEVVGQLYRGLQGLVKAAGVTTIAAEATFTSPSQVALSDGSSVEARNFVIATGSRPRPLPGLEPDGRTVLDSDGLLALEAPPASLAVLGSGAVGLEFASCFADYGAAVTLVEMLPRIAPLEDVEVSRQLTRSFEARGIRVLVGARAFPETLKRTDDGLRLDVERDGGRETLNAAALLVAIGRVPNTESLGLDVAGVRTERGFIPVDAAQRTNVAGIYAVGDVTGSLQLAHVAAAQGTLAADTIAAVPSPPVNFERLPRATYCRPQIASIGLSEEDARGRGLPVRTGRAHFRANGKALIGGEPDGFVKVVSNQSTGDVLGVHIIGAHATELIAEIALGQFLDMAVWELAASVHPHPTLSETLAEAAQRALGRHGVNVAG